MRYALPKSAALTSRPLSSPRNMQSRRYLISSNNARINAVFWRFGHVSTSNKAGLLTQQVMFDIRNKMNLDPLMISWRLHTFPHVVEGVISVNLIHFSANGEFPEMIVVVVVVYMESMLAIVGEENPKLYMGPCCLVLSFIT
jgi:hypothetical protein